MTIINLRTADGFTLHDNYYAIPDDMPLERVGEVVDMVSPYSFDWEHLNRNLADYGITPAQIPTIDIEF